MKWPFSSPIDTESHHVCRCQRHGLGLLMGLSSRSRILYSRGSISIHQLEGIESGPFSSQDTPSTAELCGTNQDRQRNKSFLHQQSRRYSLSASTGTSNRGLDMVSTTQDYDSSSTYSKQAEYDCGLRVSPTISQEPMDDQATNIPTTAASMGPVINRSICRQGDQTVTKVRVMDLGPRRIAVHTMDSVSSPLCKSPVEFDIASLEQNQAGTSPNSNSGGTLPASALWFPLLLGSPWLLPPQAVRTISPMTPHP